MRFPFSGLIPVDKPAGVSSRQVVDVVGRCLGLRSVGHAGTLDPLASGVVLVCVGHATKLVDFIHRLPKAYAADFLLGRSSPSDDLETPVEEEVAPRRPTRDEIERALADFRGEIRQRPCDYSAVHVDGKRAYRLVRRGREVSLPEKAVRIDRLEVTGYDWPRLALAIDCSTGTFVRAIGRDLAAVLGTTAVMESLVRGAVGPFAQAEAIPFAALTADTVAAALLAPLAAVPHLPQATLADPVLDIAVRGGLVSLPTLVSTGRVVIPGVDPADAVAAVDVAGDLVGILRPHVSGGWRLRPNFRGLG